MFCVKDLQNMKNIFIVHLKKNSMCISIVCIKDGMFLRMLVNDEKRYRDFKFKCLRKMKGEFQGWLIMLMMMMIVGNVKSLNANEAFKNQMFRVVNLIGVHHVTSLEIIRER